MVAYLALGAAHAMVGFNPAPDPAHYPESKGPVVRTLGTGRGIDRSFMDRVETVQHNVSCSTLCRLAAIISQAVGAFCEGPSQPRSGTRRGFTPEPRQTIEVPTLIETRRSRPFRLAEGKGPRSSCPCLSA